MHGDDTVDGLLALGFKICLLLAILCLIRPALYVSRVLYRTGSGYLLGSVMILLICLVLTVVTQVALFGYLTAFSGAGALVHARVLDSQLVVSGADDDSPFLP